MYATLSKEAGIESGNAKPGWNTEEKIVQPILDMFITMSNTTGDMVTALIVARSEKMLDVEKYRS